jgi:hypothetical protein
MDSVTGKYEITPEDERIIDELSHEVGPLERGFNQPAEDVVGKHHDYGKSPPWASRASRPWHLTKRQCNRA